MKKEYAQKLKLLLVMAAFGCIGPIVRAIGLPSAVIACLRAWIAAIVLILYLVLSKHEYDRAAAKKAAAPMIFSGIFISVNWIMLFESYRFTTIAAATVCYYLAPVIVFLASPLVLGESFRPKHAVCAAVSFFGMALVSGVSGNGLPAAAELRGILFAVLAACFYAAVILINKKNPSADPLVRTTVQFSMAALFTTPYILLTTEIGALQFSPKSILYLLLLGVLMTAFVYDLYFTLIVDIPARSVAIFSYADPVVAVFISAIFLGEPLSLAGLIGSVLIIGAAIVSEF